MPLSVPTLDERSDAELISAVRAGDVGAYGELFSRHVDAARRLGRQLVPGPDVDDLVSEAFAKVLGVLQRGGGPDLAFRAYLLTSVRRLHVDRIRASARLHSTDDLTPFDPGVPFRDTAVEGFENATAARAFSALPERWQLVLWHTEVEGQKPADVAPLLGMTPNAVSALAYRAREGLRQAYLSMHAADVHDDACERARGELGAYVRGGLSRRDAARVEQHLEHCRPCTALYLELTEVNSNLGALIAPLLLGAAATAYVATGAAGAGAAAAGLGALIDRAKDFVLAHGPATAVAGVAASAVVAGLVVTLPHDHPAPDAIEVPEIAAPPHLDPSPRPTASRVVQVDRPLRRERTGSTNGGRLTGGPAPTATGQQADSTPQAPAPPEQTVPAAEPSSGPTAPATAEPTERPPAPSQPPQPTQPAQPKLVDLHASVSAGPDGIEVGLGLGVGGATVIPDTTLGLPGASLG